MSQPTHGDRCKTEHRRMETCPRPKRYTANDLLQQGGEWLGAARERIKSMKCSGNGEHVRWGSSDVIEPHMTIGQVEEIAAEAATAAFTERADTEAQIEKMRSERLLVEIELAHRVERAEAEVAKLRNILTPEVQEAIEAWRAIPKHDNGPLPAVTQGYVAEGLAKHRDLYREEFRGAHDAALKLLEVSGGGDN